MENTLTIASRLMADLQRDYGLTRAQAAGVVGNFAHETAGFTAMQERGSKRGGFGYAQWTGPRRNNFENWAKKQGLSPTSYEANYGFLKHEIANDPYERRQFLAVKDAKTASEAAEIVSKKFLRPGTPRLESRKEWTSQFVDLATPVPPANIPQTAPVPQPTIQRPSVIAPIPAPTIARPQAASATPPTIAPTPADAFDRVTARNRYATAQPSIPAMPSLPRSDPRSEGQKFWATTSFGQQETAERLARQAGAQFDTVGSGATLAELKALGGAKPSSMPPIPRPASDATIARTFAAAQPDPISSFAADLGANNARVGANTQAPVQMPRIAVFQPLDAAPPRIDPIGSMPSAADLAAGFAPRIAQPTTASKAQDRLAANAPIVAPTSNSVGQLYNPAHPLVRDNLPAAPLIDAPAAPPQSAPVPMPTIQRPDIAPGLAAAPGLAPNPAARIQRDGFLPQVDLPGLAGFAQDISRTFANASGPFNNGIDNALYQQFRGSGVMSLPPPTIVNGYRAQGLSPQAAYDAANYAARARASLASGGSGAPGQGTSKTRGENKYNPNTNTWERK